MNGRLAIQRHWRARLTEEQTAELKAWCRKHRRHPHQPCPAKPRRRQAWHTYATRVPKEFGLEAARIILGHRTPAVTTIYVEADRPKAINAMMGIGQQD